MLEGIANGANAHNFGPIGGNESDRTANIWDIARRRNQHIKKVRVRKVTKSRPVPLT